MKLRIFLISLTLIFIQYSKAQLPNAPFYILKEEKQHIPKRVTSNNKFIKINPLHKVGEQIYLDFQTLFFVKNNEYFSNIEPGYTFFGYQLYPTLVWRPFKDDNFALKGGLFLQKNFGDIGLEKNIGTFTLDYQFKHTRFVFGTLYGGLEHKLIEPIYQFERGLYDRIENGFQIIHNTDKLFVDAWINWKQTVDVETNRQEILQSGISLYYYIKGSSISKFSSRIITQMTNQHKGGSSIATPLTNRTNNVVGFDLAYGTKKKIKFWFEPYFVHSLDHSITLTQPFKDGMGVYINGGATRKNFTFITSYWKGWEYFSPLGMPLFNSFNYDDYQIVKRNREILFFRLIYSQKLINNNLRVNLRFEPIYEISENKFQHSLGIYFIYRMGV